MPLNKNHPPSLKLRGIVLRSLGEVGQKFRILDIVQQALKEDIGTGDITTNLLIPKQLKVKAIILAKEKGIIAGMDVARLVFRVFDRRIKFRPQVKDGSLVKARDIIANLEGSAKGILSAERTALNFLSRLSGIATQTHKFVKAVSRWKVKIMDTRKTTPNLRCLEKYAVKVGGGYNHRMGLFDMMLIKDNHIRVKGQGSRVKDLIQEVRKRASKGMKIEIEVKSLKEFRDALKARPGPDIIMLDNMSLKEIKRAVQLRNNLRPNTYNLTPKLEVSGRVSLKNIREIAKTGVEMISIGSLTHSVESLDISLEVLK